MLSALRCLLYLVCFIVSQVGAPVLAAPPASKADDDVARGLFQAGKASYEAGKFKDALEFFEQAYQRSQRPGFLFNIGQTADRLRDDDKALASFKSYLQRMPDAPNRVEVQQRIDALADAEHGDIYKAAPVAAPTVRPAVLRTEPFTANLPGLGSDAATTPQATLRRDIEITQRLIDAAPTNDPRLPDYRFRIAHVYGALAYAIDRASGRTTLPRASGAETEEAIKALATLVKDYPTWSKMHAVLYYLGAELAYMGQMDRTRQVLHRLIKDHPQSEYVPFAYLHFAEYYYAQRDYVAAAQFYAKVTEFPAGRNQASSYSTYRMAWCAYLRRDYRVSLERFTQAIEQTTETSSPDILQYAREQSVLAYVEVGDPERALDFFTKYAASDEQARSLVAALAKLYDEHANPKAASAVRNALRLAAN